MRRLLSPRWLGRHLLMVAGVIALVALGRWQWHRAHDANGTLQNLFYAVQWLFFAGFVVFLWWKLLREEFVPPVAPTTVNPTTVQVPVLVSEKADPEEDDPELAAYNRYLAELSRRSG